MQLNLKIIIGILQCRDEFIYLRGNEMTCCQFWSEIKKKEGNIRSEPTTTELQVRLPVITRIIL